MSEQELINRLEAEIRNHIASYPVSSRHIEQAALAIAKLLNEEFLVINKSALVTVDMRGKQLSPFNPIITPLGNANLAQST